MSATCASVASAGWQQVKISASRSSGITVVLVVLARVLRRARAARVLRCERLLAPDPVDRAVARRRDDPGAAGSPATPSRGQRSAAIDEGVLDRVLGEVEVAEDAAEDRERRAPHSSRKSRASSSMRRLRRAIDERPNLDRRRTRRRDARRPLDRLVERLGLDQVVAAERLLRLGERAVGDERLAAADPHSGRGRRSAAARRRLTSLPSARMASGEREVLAADRCDRSRPSTALVPRPRR